jgi:hypothetical protein
VCARDYCCALHSVHKKTTLHIVCGAHLEQVVCGDPRSICLWHQQQQQDFSSCSACSNLSIKLNRNFIAQCVPLL